MALWRSSQTSRVLKAGVSCGGHVCPPPRAWTGHGRPYRPARASVIRCPFHSPLSATSFIFLRVLWVTLLFKVASERGTEVPCAGPTDGRPWCARWRGQAPGGGGELPWLAGAGSQWILGMARPGEGVRSHQSGGAALSAARRGRGGRWPWVHVLPLTLKAQRTVAVRPQGRKVSRWPCLVPPGSRVSGHFGVEAGEVGPAGQGAVGPGPRHRAGRAHVDK